MERLGISNPARVAATSAQSIFIGLSGVGGSSTGCNGCLGQMNLVTNPPTFQPAPQPDVTSIVGAPLLQADATGNPVFLVFHTAPGWPIGYLIVFYSQCLSNFNCQRHFFGSHRFGRWHATRRALQQCHGSPRPGPLTVRDFDFRGPGADSRARGCAVDNTSS